MRRLNCDCGQPVYFEHAECFNCGRVLGFEPLSRQLTCTQPTADNLLEDAAGQRFQLCANRRTYGVCNGLVPSTDQTSEDALCSSCQLNRTVPFTERPENIVRWRKMEVAKRRMLAGLGQLGLTDLEAGDHTGHLRFDFMEDQRSHPEVAEAFVSTGHFDGLITINLLEAEATERIAQQESLGEAYRTLLGHFRHEVAHFFYRRLATDEAGFRALFGDPDIDYSAATQRHYEQGPPAHWEQQFISAYASSHPLEDWAECFAHLMHMYDTLETAAVNGLVDVDQLPDSLADKLALWRAFSAGLNQATRSLGLGDAYPFVIHAKVEEKLQFVQDSVDRFVASLA